MNSTQQHFAYIISFKVIRITSHHSYDRHVRKILSRKSRDYPLNEPHLPSSSGCGAAISETVIAATVLSGGRCGNGTDSDDRGPKRSVPFPNRLKPCGCGVVLHAKMAKHKNE